MRYDIVSLISLLYFLQALAIAVEQGDTVSQGSTNGNIGIAYQGLGEVSLALEHLDAHLAIARECEDAEGQMKALSNLVGFFNHFSVILF